MKQVSSITFKSWTQRRWTESFLRVKFSGFHLVEIYHHRYFFFRTIFLEFDVQENSLKIKVYGAQN